MKQGMDDLKGTKYDWLTNPVNRSEQQKERFQALRKSTLRTARAWAIKEAAQKLGTMSVVPGSTRAGSAGYPGPCAAGLNPSKKLQNHQESLVGHYQAIILKVSNGPAESLNSRIKTIKVRCRGFRNKQRFVNAIYFYLGGLDVYPDGVRIDFSTKKDEEPI